MASSVLATFSPVVALCSVNEFLFIARGHVISVYLSGKLQCRSAVLGSEPISRIKFRDISNSKIRLYASAGRRLFELSYHESNLLYHHLLSSADLILDFVLFHTYIVIGNAHNFIQVYSLDSSLIQTVLSSDLLALYSMKLLLFNDELFVLSGSHRSGGVGVESSF
ncbi:hypothetical protein GEMRC1_010620 [Eukaryota sp. GEM-RC1]